MSTELTTPNGSPNAGLRELAGGIAVSRQGIVPQSMAELMDFAQLMAKAGPMVGRSFRGNPGACLGIAMQAMQWGMSPFAVSQKAYVTGEGDKENIGYEAQLVNAVINAHAPLKEPLEYTYEGEGPERVCVVSGTLRRASKPSVYRSPPLKQCAARSPLWKSDPDQQLAYYSSRAWARRYTPEVIMGVYTPEEIEASAGLIDVTPAPRAAIATDIVTDDGVATTIIPKSSYRAKQDGDDKWIASAIETLRSPHDVDALRKQERWLALPLAWRDAYAERIEARLWAAFSETVDACESGDALDKMVATLDPWLESFSDDFNPVEYIEKRREQLAA